MGIVDWLKSWLPYRVQALSSYRRGMARANKQDHAGAIDDYRATIDMPNGPPDVKAMALYNRAVVYAADRDDSKAIDDLNLVLAMAKAPADVRIEARRKLERMKRHSDQADAEQYQLGPRYKNKLTDLVRKMIAAPPKQTP